MQENRAIELMDLAIELAKKAEPEDCRVHPKVGAVLASPNGEVLLESYRGESDPGTMPSTRC